MLDYIMGWVQGCLILAQIAQPISTPTMPVTGPDHTPTPTPAPITKTTTVPTPAPRYRVYATGYSCQPHSNNPMTNSPGMCQITRWGYDPHQPGMACPVEWAERLFDVPGFGVLRCDDTPRHGWIDGLPHIDIRMSYQDAWAWGVRYIEVEATD